MPQGNDDQTAVDVPVDVPALKDEQQCPKRGILEEERSEDKIDDLRRCQQELNEMPELKDDQAEFDDEEVCLNLGEPSPEVMEYARRELGETEEVKCQTLQELRDMVYGNWVLLRGSACLGSISKSFCSIERGECLPYRMDDDFLIRFLRVRHFNVNRAHRLVSRLIDGVWFWRLDVKFDHDIGVLFLRL